MLDRIERDLSAKEPMARRLEGTRRLIADLFTLIFCGAVPPQIAGGPVRPDPITELLDRRATQLSPGNRLPPWRDGGNWPFHFAFHILIALIVRDYQSEDPRAARYGRKLLFTRFAMADHVANRLDNIEDAAMEYAAVVFRRMPRNANQSGGKSSAHVLLEHMVRYGADSADWTGAEIVGGNKGATPRLHITDTRVLHIHDALQRIGVPPGPNPLFLRIGSVWLALPAELSLGDVLNCLSWPLSDRLASEVRSASRRIRATAATLAEGKPVTAQLWDKAEGMLREKGTLPPAYKAWLAFRSLFESAEEPYRKKCTRLGVPFAMVKDLTYGEADRAALVIHCGYEFIDENVKQRTLARQARTVLAENPALGIEGAYEAAWKQESDRYTIREFKRRDDSENIFKSWETFRASPYLRGQVAAGRIAEPSPLALETAYSIAWDLMKDKAYMGKSDLLNSRDAFLGSAICRWKIERPYAPNRSRGKEASSIPVLTASGLTPVEQMAMGVLLKLHSAEDIAEADRWSWLRANCDHPEVEAAVRRQLAQHPPYSLVAGTPAGTEAAWALFLYYLRRQLQLHDPEDDLIYGEPEIRAYDLRNALPIGFERADFIRILQQDRELNEALDQWIIEGSPVYRTLDPVKRITVFAYFFTRDTQS